MATRTGPDLTPAVRAVERLMDDTCVIIRNPAGVADAVLNPVTFELVDPAATAPVYKGKCSLSPAGGLQAGGRPRSEGGSTYQETVTNLSIPLTSPALKDGDIVTMTSSRRDPGLKGQSFRIVSVMYSSMAVSRKATLEGRR